MGSREREAATPASSKPEGASAEAAVVSDGSSSAGVNGWSASAVMDWLAGAKSPVVLRLPRAVLVVVLLMLLLALVIAFAAGRAQGWDAGHKAGSTEREHQERNILALWGSGSTQGPKGVTDATQAGDLGGTQTAPNTGLGRVWRVSDGERRLIRHNYCLMGYWREPKAEAVANHFAASGFDVGIVPFNNDRFHVAVLSLAIPSGDPEFQSKKRQFDVTIRQYLRGYLNQTGERSDMQRMLTWARFDG